MYSIFKGLFFFLGGGAKGLAASPNWFLDIFCDGFWKKKSLKTSPIHDWFMIFSLSSSNKVLE